MLANYIATTPRKLEVAEQFAADMIEMLAREEQERMQGERLQAISAIEAGLLRRSLFLARRSQRT